MADFVHLHVHSEYSLLDGAGRVSDLIRRAGETGMSAVALTDHGNMYGAVEFYKQAKKHGIKPIIGCEVYIAPRSRFDKVAIEGESYYHLVLLAETQAGYSQLVELVSRAYTEGFYYKPRIDKELLAAHHEGLIGLSACIAGEIPSLILKGNLAGAEAAAREYVDIFGQDNFFIEIQDHGIAEQKDSNPQLVELARKLGVGLVATNDIHYIDRADADAHDVLLCIQTGKCVEDAGRMRFPTSEFYLKTGEEMSHLFPEYPEAISNTCRIAERCQVEFEFGHLRLPDFPLPDGETADNYLKELCEAALPVRYPDADSVERERLEYELSVIQAMGFSSYFLIVWDFVRFARESRIPVGPGRGSAAGSIVAYLLKITNIDPLKYGLLFERFLNPERVTMPDIDIDFCYVRRGKIIEYVAQRYGADHVAQIITFGTMAARAAIRDVGRALNAPFGEVDRIAKLVPTVLNITLKDALAMSQELKSAYDKDPTARKILDLAMSLEGLPRHASTHAAGLVIARDSLNSQVPVQSSADGFITTQFDKDCIEEIGFLKMDLLGLRTLTVIGDAVDMISQYRGINIDMEAIPLDDAVTCEMLCRGETAGVFQMESGGMTNLVKDLRPQRFDDLIPLVALYRPGPLNSGMVEDFVHGRHGVKKTVYQHPLLEPILSDTFGVILYQEQVMQIASVMGGFTLGQADLLRRAMGKKKHDVLAAQRERFLAGATGQGVEATVANEVFSLMEKFADYGFNKSHSAAYALVAYQTAYLKAHYPEEFMAAMLTSVMGDSGRVGYFIEECRKHGIKILPPDVNRSALSFSVEESAIRFGLAGVKNVGEGAIDSILKARSEGDFKSLVDFCERIDMRLVNKRVLESLIKCGALDSTGWRRAQLLAVSETAVELAASRQRDKASGQMGLFGEEQMGSFEELVPPDLEELPKPQILAMEKEMTGFFVTGHPLDEYREELKGMYPVGTLLSTECTDNQSIKIAGIVMEAKRIPTKNGETMCFVTVEDFTGSIEVIVFPRVFERAGPLLTPDRPISVSGRLSITEDKVKVIAETVKPLGQKNAQEVRINIRREQETPEIFEGLKEIFTACRGEATVYLQLLDQKRLIKTDKNYWIN
ncbi:MAG TPA: DNA polymerase III subunit alpha, partial [Negativicutes bacterium]|nr:DNA polymerase III subunit alpha [Negativicutes bacterium]